jgi:hypothetical protein
VQQLKDQLQRYGLAGVLAYGLLNTAYYSTMFLFVWVYVAQVPAGLGLPGAARKFLEVFALTWGGSQVRRARGGVAVQNCLRLGRGGGGWLGCHEFNSGAVESEVPNEAGNKKTDVTPTQVTKLARAGGALALAPLADRLLDWLQVRMRLKTKRQAFATVVAACVGLALALFGGVVAAHA